MRTTHQATIIRTPEPTANGDDDAVGTCPECLDPDRNWYANVTCYHNLYLTAHPDAREVRQGDCDGHEPSDDQPTWTCAACHTELDWNLQAEWSRQPWMTW